MYYSSHTLENSFQSKVVVFLLIKKINKSVSRNGQELLRS